MDIVVTKRSDDYHAALADNSAVWESGKSYTEAIGKLMISAGSMMGITILLPEKTKKKK
jgi:predicted RNase H-like HicB family nuclease